MEIKVGLETITEHYVDLYIKTAGASYYILTIKLLDTLTPDYTINVLKKIFPESYAFQTFEGEELIFKCEEAPAFNIKQLYGSRKNISHIYIFGRNATEEEIISTGTFGPRYYVDKFNEIKKLHIGEKTFEDFKNEFEFKTKEKKVENKNDSFDISKIKNYIYGIRYYDPEVGLSPMFLSNANRINSEDFMILMNALEMKEKLNEEKLNVVEEYKLISSDRGVEGPFSKYSSTRNPLEYMKNIGRDICAFRFYNEEKGYSPTYIIGKEYYTDVISKLIIDSYGFSKDVSVIMKSPNGCYYDPKLFGEIMSIKRYAGVLEDLEEYKGYGATEQVEMYYISDNHRMSRILKVSKTRSPLDIIDKIGKNICAFRFFNPEDEFSPMYLVGDRLLPSEVSDLKLKEYGIDKNCNSVIYTQNGCYFCPDNYCDNITLDEYAKTIQIDKGNCAPQFLKR